MYKLSVSGNGRGVATDGIPVFLGIRTALAAEVFKGVEDRDGTAQEHKTLQG